MLEKTGSFICSIILTDSNLMLTMKGNNRVQIKQGTRLHKGQAGADWIAFQMIE